MCKIFELLQAYQILRLISQINRDHPAMQFPRKGTKGLAGLTWFDGPQD